MDTIKFTCDVAVKDATDKPLCVAVHLNNKEVFPPSKGNESLHIYCHIPDEEDKEWKLELVVSCKTDDHTVLDSENNVLSSTELTFNNFEFDSINIDSVILTNSLPYTHNFNGTSETVTEKFYDTAGCNGTIQINFTTPFYIWLLENM